MPRYTHLLLDLDDTLYPGTSGVWDAVRDRIQTFIVSRLSIPEKDATDLRRRYLEQYGTTLSGLVEEHNVDIKVYLDYVHDVPLEQYLAPDPGLREMLASIKIPRVIFTNSYQPHAQRVIEQLGVQDQIDQIIDIYALGFINKPKLEAYHIALYLISSDDPSRVVLVDDRLANLKPAADLNMVTVLVGPRPETNSHLHIEQIGHLTKLLPGLKGHYPGESDD